MNIGVYRASKARLILAFFEDKGYIIVYNLKKSDY